jgi:hypothetical protein
MKGMSYNAGDRKDVRQAEKQAKLWEQQRREIVTGIMSVAPGRQWMCDILEHCHIFHTSYNDVSGRMAFMEGQREVGILLLNDIMQSCPDEYVVMMRERNERQSTIDARLNRKDSGRSDSGSGADYGPESDYGANFDDAGYGD